MGTSLANGEWIPLRPILGWYLKYKGKVTFSFYGKRNSPHDSREAPLSVQAFAHVQNGCFIPFSGKLLPRRCFRRKLAQISLASLLFSSKSGNRVPRIPASPTSLLSPKIAFSGGDHRSAVGESFVDLGSLLDKSARYDRDTYIRFHFGNSLIGDCGHYLYHICL